jgi:hypothetical protein
LYGIAIILHPNAEPLVLPVRQHATLHECSKQVPTAYRPAYSLTIPDIPGANTWLMIPRLFLNRFIILGFMAIVGFCLARSIYYESVMGVILALISLGASIYFLYLVVKMKEEMEAERTT